MTSKKPPAPTSAPASSKEQKAQRRLADMGGKAPDIKLVPRRQPAS